MAWSSEQKQNAAIIIRTGHRLGASNRDIITALMAAIVESSLRNLHGGDRDSVGLFQQRDAWGSFAERTNPAASAAMFFTGGHAGQNGLFDIDGRNHMSMGRAAQTVQVSAYPDRYDQHAGEAQQLLGIAPGANLNSDFHTNTSEHTLASVPGINDMSHGLGASGPVEPSTTIVNPLGEITAGGSGIGEVGSDVNLSNPMGATGGNRALDALSFDSAGPTAPTPTTDGSGGGSGGGGGGSYSGGGGSDPMADLHVEDLFAAAGYPSGGGGGVGLGGGGQADPTLGVSGWRGGVVNAARKMLGTPYVWGGTGYGGVDCSGLIKLIFDKQGIKMPRISADQARTGVQVGLNQLQPGDLVAWDNSSRNNGADHIALYIGGGHIIEAARPGTNVQVSNIYDTGRAWGVRMGVGEASLQVGAGAGSWGAQPNVAAAGHRIANKFGITDVGGYSNRNIAGTADKSDHAFGLALDFMGGKQNLADYVQKNAMALNVKYVIYNNRIWSVDRADEGWRAYDGADPHTSHVHVSFNSDADAFAYRNNQPSRSGDGRAQPKQSHSQEQHTQAIVTKHQQYDAQSDSHYSGGGGGGGGGGHPKKKKKQHYSNNPVTAKHQHLDNQFDQTH